MLVLNTNIAKANQICEILPDGSIHCYTIYPISLNSIEDVHLGTGGEKTYFINISDNKYYIVETFGNHDTHLSVSGLSTGILTDNNSGVLLNSAIGFKGETNRTIQITVRLNSSLTSGSFQLQIRKQQAVLYGFDYPDKPDGTSDINTKPDLNKPYDDLSNLYNTYKFSDNTNHSGSHMLSLDSRDHTRLNSEIVFFSGHGYGSKNGSQGSGVSFPSGSVWVYQLNSMENVKVVVWASCYSSNSNNSYNNSMSQGSVDAGATSAIGWPDTTTVGSSRVFTDRLFNKLSAGETIAYAANYAKNGLIWPWDNVRDYEIDGSTTAKITASYINKLNDTANSNIVKEFNNRILKEKGWYFLDNEDGTKRVYRTINGKLTNDFYDIEYFGNEILSIKHSGVKMENQNILSINSIKTKIPDQVKVFNIVFDRLVDVEKYNVYYIYEEEIIPIEIKYCTYETEGGLIYVDTICTNLNDNTSIDYSKICGIRGE